LGDLRAELIEHADLPQSLRDEWDALSVCRGRPFSAPAWMLSWWNHARPVGADLRIVTLWDGAVLAGILPLFVERARTGVPRYRLLAADTAAHVEPLARPGREREVAAVGVELLSTANPRPNILSLHGLSLASPWPDLIRGSWPDGRAVGIYRGRGMPAPSLTLEGTTYEDWFRALSSHRRSEFRRRRRRLEERGATARLIDTAEEIPRHLEEFAALHYERWKQRGGSGALDKRIEAVLVDAGLELAPKGRFRIWSITAGQKSICSLVFVAAGGDVSYWLGGFDPDWSAYGPAIEAVRAALEHAWAVGDRRVDFGPGGQHYKYTFAKEADIVQSIDLVPHSPGHFRARAALTPEHLSSTMRSIRYETFRRLSPGVQQRLKALRRRLRSARRGVAGT
jgi:CelD/BcsL family acetyltransferase involved in cellulose biosynthesis